MKQTYSISNKIIGLKQMQDMGFNVPHFDFIPDYSELGLKNIDININYPPSILKEIIKSKLKKFNKKNGISVRSASFDEDTGNQSSAGRYISFNGLSTEKEIINATITIWLHHRLNSKNVICPLILQETHPSFYSGVAFKDDESTIIESYYGACSNIVNGSIRPYITIIKNNKISHQYSENNNFISLYSVHKNIFKNSNKISGETLKPKLDFYTSNSRLYKYENNKILCVYANRPDKPIKLYEEKILPQVIEITKKLDNTDGVDIEWGSDINGNVYLYQFRKLTRKLSDLNVNIQPKKINKNQIFGIPVSKGIVEGQTTYDKNNPKENSILIIQNDNIEDVEILSKIKGIISYNGGVLSHLSIICRELNIPCIVGVDSSIPDNRKILLNGTTGEIKILD